MIALDTNVISELMRDEPHPAVRAWFNRQRRNRLCLPSVVMAELIFGVEDLPPGKRRDALRRTLYTWLDMFAYRVLPLDELAAHSYGKRAAAARRAGRPLPVADGYIAAICAAHGHARCAPVSVSGRGSRQSVGNGYRKALGYT